MLRHFLNEVAGASLPFSRSLFSFVFLFSPPGPDSAGDSGDLSVCDHGDPLTNE